MKIASDFYVHKVAAVISEGKFAVEVTLRACGDHIAEPPEEMMNPLTLATESFQACGVLILRVTNEKLKDVFRPNAKFKITLEEAVGAVHMPQAGGTTGKALANEPAGSQRPRTGSLVGCPA